MYDTFDFFRNFFECRSFARLGEHDLSSNSDGEVQDIKIVRTVKHPAYDEYDKTNDIAVLYLEHDAELTCLF